MKPQVSLEKVLLDFMEHMRQSGLVPPREIIPDGKIHRFSSSGRPRDDAGWYVFYADPVAPFGYYGDWRGNTPRRWEVELGRELTAEERKRIRSERVRIQSAVQMEVQEQQAAAAERAVKVWKLGEPARADHPYLVRKQVEPVATLRELPLKHLKELLGYHPHGRGEFLQGRVLLVPVKVGGGLATLEFIDEAGTKSALFHGAKSGGYWATEALPPAGRVFVAEGVATALSLRMALGVPVAAALSANNFRKAGEALLKEHPDRELVLMADMGPDGCPPDGALVAQAHLGCALLIPSLRFPDKTDFNDLHVQHGLEVLRADLEKALASLAGPADDAVGASSEPGMGRMETKKEPSLPRHWPYQSWQRE